MKILLTGILPHSIWTIASRMSRGGDQIAVLGHGSLPMDVPAGVAYHDMHPGHSNTLKLMEAAHYEAVVFFFAFQCEEAREYGSNQGAMLDALFAILAECGRCGVKRFALVTDQRVFGEGQRCHEDETPMPDTPTGVLIKAAEDCLFCGVPDGVSPLLVRVSSLYGPNDPNSFFALAQNCEKSKTPLLLTGGPDTPCDFLHADDLGAFLSLALDGNMSGVAHAAYGKARTYGEVLKAFAEVMPGLSVIYTNGTARQHALSVEAAHAVDWVPRHDMLRELDTLQSAAPAQKSDTPRRAKSRFGKALGVVAPWLELLALWMLAAHLQRVAATNTIFAAVDYMLLFVAVMGTVHGRKVGAAAAVLACVSYAVSWVTHGNQLYLLLYNPDHWLPLCAYLLCGTLFGYLRDKLYLQLEVLRRENADLASQNDFLQTMYHQAYEDRNQLQEQVLRSRDSYGRIYHITRELDTLQPEQVFLSTLDVLEDTLQSQSVAIYECKPEAVFARLVVHSRGLKHLSRSLDLERFSEMTECLMQGRMFSNTGLRDGYPAYAAPVMHDGALKAVLVLWDVPFDKQTQYYENLFSVVAGLVQSAMVRALRYLSMSGDIYIEDAHILSDRAFRSALGVYQNIRKRRTGQYLLVRVLSDQPLTPQQYDAQIGRAVRSTDLIGRLDDGCYYVLFPQATAENLQQISARFRSQGLGCEVVSQEVAYAG